MGWLKAPVIFARNDGNLTHMEALLGMGTIESIIKIVVNDVEIPKAVQGQDTTITGWYNVITMGNRDGNFNLDFTDSNGIPLGDPYGSMSVLSIVVPNRINSGRSLPNVEVLLQGMQIDSYNPDGTFQNTAYTNNPAWVILDILRRCGWSTSDLDLASFASAAEFCQTLISTTDLNGNTIQLPRFECNLILTKRQSAAVIVRGIRVGSSLMLRYGWTGLLQLLPETTIAAQQPILPDGGNSTDDLYGGWPAYEFSDSSAAFSGIVRAPNGASTVRLSSRSIAETSNRLSVEFQDESNEYQQDSFSVVDADDAALIGYEISSQSTALGVANFSQANRVLLRQLDKSTKGNQFVQFQTSFRALKVRPGDIIALTYLKEGFTRVPFRVVKLSPSMNYQIVTILAQIHDDDWYSDNPAVLGGAGRQPGTGVQSPRPLIGTLPHLDSTGALEYFDFGVEETIQTQNDGAATDILTVSFAEPGRPDANSPYLPLLSLSPQYGTSGGTLWGGSSLYYAVSAVDAVGNEGALSFTVGALIPPGADTNSVSITGLSFPSKAASFNVYRGATPQMLYRIATAIPLSGTYSDIGAPAQPAGPPDTSFDHANFYYRFEYAGPFTTTLFSATMIGSGDMDAASLAYSGMVVRIIEGTGRGQERLIATNDQTTLTVSPAWSVLPDPTSTFVIAEGSWKFGAVSATSPVQFEISYRAGAVLQISGRGANVNDQEGTAELCPLTRWPLGGGKSDAGIPGLPDFLLTVPGGGNVTIFDIGFEDLDNTSSVSSGTLEIFSWNELQPPSSYFLAAALDNTVGTIFLNQIASPLVGDFIQSGTELMGIISVDSTANSYTVLRGALDSAATTHQAGDPVLHLQRAILILPFARDFFANRASGNYLHTASLPDVRISAAQLYVSNSFGDSQARSHSYTADPDGGLRTLSGGQFSLQVSGYLATQQNASPPLIIEASHAIRDMRATVNQAPQNYIINIAVLQNGVPLSGDVGVLSIGSGNLTSNVIDGINLPALEEDGALTLDITLEVPESFSTSVDTNPGRDLTVTIRL